MRPDRCLSRAISHIVVILLASFGTFFQSAALADELGGQFRNPTFVAVKVENITGYTDWLGTVFGLKQVKEISLPNNGGRIIIMQNRGLVFEVLAMNEDKAAGSLGLFKAGIQVRDADQMFARMKRLDMNLVTPVFADEEMRVRSFVMKGPEGNIFQIWQYPEEKPTN